MGISFSVFLTYVNLSLSIYSLPWNYHRGSFHTVVMMIRNICNVEDGVTGFHIDPTGNRYQIYLSFGDEIYYWWSDFLLLLWLFDPP